MSARPDGVFIELYFFMIENEQLQTTVKTYFLTALFLYPQTTKITQQHPEFYGFSQYGSAIKQFQIHSIWYFS